MGFITIRFLVLPIHKHTSYNLWNRFIAIRFLVLPIPQIYDVLPLASSYRICKYSNILMSHETATQPQAVLLSETVLTGGLAT